MQGALLTQVSVERERDNSLQLNHYETTVFISLQDIATIQQAAQKDAGDLAEVQEGADESLIAAEEAKENLHLNELLEAAKKATSLWDCVKVRDLY
jgi:hypothetical protein